MLILVGVTINFALNGGLINKAKQASSDYQKAADREELQMAVISSMDYTTGEINFSDLERSLPNWDISGNGPATCVSPSGNVFTVAIDGTITEAGEVTPGGSSSSSESPSYDSGSGSYSDDSSSEDGEGTIGLDYNNNSIVLGPGVEVIAYENLEYLNSTEANLGTNLKNAVDSGKVSAVLREEEKSNGLDYIAVIPTGFTVSSISGENTILGGLVVRDSLNNEFVWIPVQDISDMAVPQEQGSSNYRGVLYNWDTDSTGQTQYSWSASSTDYREPANLTGTTYDGNNYICDSQEAFTYYGGGTYTSTMYQTEFNNMVESVAKYKGFYVGRYETGGFNGSTIVVKAGETGTEDSSSANNSINYATWYKMYQMQKDFASTNTNIASTMIWGCQWDQVMKFVDEKEDGTGNTFDVTTLNSSRHTNSLAVTGNNINDKVQNIYDLEGNVYEWTLEAVYTNYRVGRGGSYSGSYCSAFRVSYSPYNCYYDGYRKPSHTLYKVTLYAERKYAQT